MKMQLTFKQTEKKLWEEVCRHHSKSGFIKDALAAYMKKEQDSKPKQALKVF